MKSYQMLLVIFLQAVLVSYVLSRDSINYKVGVVNKDVEITEGVCPYKASCSLRNLSCRYIAHLKNQSISEDYYPDLVSGLNALKRPDVLAVLYINETFTDALVAAIILEEDTDEETIKAIQIPTWLDQSKEKTSESLKQSLESAFKDFIKDILTTCNHNDRHLYFSTPFVFYPIDK